jgi:hypothetical protein
MVSYPKYKCWEIVNCDNLNCPARHEPETPCWEISQRIVAYHSVSNTCKDCIVYILKEKTSALSKKELHNIIRTRGLLKNIGTGLRACILKANTAG